MKVKPNLAVSENGFIFDPATGDSYSCNPVGAEMIELIKKNASPEEIKKHFIEKYNVLASTIEKDLVDFKSILKQYRLIEE
ncbi:MAG: PqqD family protein [Bacteroidia bacterium]|nr:PqqD family protein [Bacteroidia bacterium]